MSGKELCQEKIQNECNSIVDNFTKIIKASKVPDGKAVGAQKAPGELLEVFAEKILLSTKNVLEVSNHLKRQAILNDIPSRRREMKVVPGDESMEEV